MNCTKCGSPVEGKFCVVCGNRVDAAPVAPVAPVAPTFNQPVAPAPMQPAPMQPVAPAPMQPAPMQPVPMQPMGFAPVVPVAVGPDAGKGLGIASLVLGLLSLITVWIAFGAESMVLFVIDIIMAIVGIVLGAIGISKSKPRTNGMAIAGLILSIIMLILVIILFIIACSIVAEASRYYSYSRYWY